jgi:formylglycine-generating enzyme required for sulfatase activity
LLDVDSTDAGADVVDDLLSEGSTIGESGGLDGRSDAFDTDGADGGSGVVEEPFSSCTPAGPGRTNCGPDAGSCCASLEVKGGTFSRTYDSVYEDGGYDPDATAVIGADGGATAEADPATVSEFRLDTYLVTVGRFRQFVNALMMTDAGLFSYLPPAGSGKHAHLNGGRGLANCADPRSNETGWLPEYDSYLAPTAANLDCDYVGQGIPDYSTWTSSPRNQENLPINCVNWYESYAFCIWDGGFLPSEAEWEYAAAGGQLQREYPWGSTPPGTTNQYAIYDFYYPSGSGTGRGVANIAPVGAAPLGAGYWGQLDLGGELFEWNLDWFAPYTDTSTDCSYLSIFETTVDYRICRGGQFNLPAITMVVPYRNALPPPSRSAGVGFRCARTP